MASPSKTVEALIKFLGGASNKHRTLGRREKGLIERLLETEAKIGAAPDRKLPAPEPTPSLPLADDVPTTVPDINEPTPSDRFWTKFLADQFGLETKAAGGFSGNKFSGERGPGPDPYIGGTAQTFTNVPENNATIPSIGNTSSDQLNLLPPRAIRDVPDDSVKELETLSRQEKRELRSKFKSQNKSGDQLELFLQKNPGTEEAIDPRFGVKPLAERIEGRTKVFNATGKQQFNNKSTVEGKELDNPSNELTLDKLLRNEHKLSLEDRKSKRKVKQTTVSELRRKQEEQDQLKHLGINQDQLRIDDAAVDFKVSGRNDPEQFAKQFGSNERINAFVQDVFNRFDIKNKGSRKETGMFDKGKLSRATIKPNPNLTPQQEQLRSMNSKLVAERKQLTASAEVARDTTRSIKDRQAALERILRIDNRLSGTNRTLDDVRTDAGGSSADPVINRQSVTQFFDDDLSKSYTDIIGNKRTDKNLEAVFDDMVNARPRGVKGDPNELGPLARTLANRTKQGSGFDPSQLSGPPGVPVRPQQGSPTQNEIMNSVFRELAKRGNKPPPTPRQVVPNTIPQNPTAELLEQRFKKRLGR